MVATCHQYLRRNKSNFVIEVLATWFNKTHHHSEGNPSLKTGFINPNTTTKTLICPGWKTPVIPVSQPETPVPFCPGSGNRDKREPFVPVGNTNRDKRVRQPRGRWLYLLSRLPDPGQKGTPFCPGLAFPVGKPGQQGFPNRDKSTFL